MRGFAALGMALGAMVLSPAALAAPVTHAPPAHAADYLVTENAHSGGYFAATNTSADAGSIYQDVALDTSAGQTVCGSAWVRSEVPSTGASGTFALFLLGSSATDGGSGQFGGLAFGNDAWTQVHGCVEATGSHTTLRVQLYPTVGSPTVEIDDINVTESLAANAGFETGGGGWSVYPSTGTNFAVYGNSPGAPSAHSGSHWGAVNTSADAGSIYQDVALNTSPGATVCGSAWVRSETPATGASGTFALFLLGSAAQDGAGANFSGLPNGNNWTQVHTCVEATGAHTTLRVQLYPTVGSPTVEIDDINVTESLAANAGFETGGGGWSVYPSTGTNFAVYPNGAIKATIVTPVAVQPQPQPTPIPLPRGKHALKIRLVIKWTWRYGTTRISKIAIGHFPHSTHLTLTCKGKGCPRPLKLSAKGPKRIHALLKKLIGRRYHTGDVLLISFTAKGWHRERARITIRRGRKPLVTRA